MPGEPEMDQELKDLKSNARNLEECLRTLMKRIDELEGRKSVSQVSISNAASSPRDAEAGKEGKEAEEDITKLVAETPREENAPPNPFSSSSRTEVVTGADGVKRTYLTHQFITTTTKTYNSPTTNTISSFLLGGSGGKNGMGKAESVTVGLRKKKGDSHLIGSAYLERLIWPGGGGRALLQGLTVKEEEGQLVVARILNDSPLAKQDVLSVGDVILEVNGAEVKTPDDLQSALKAAGEGVSVKIVPCGLDRAPPIEGTFVKAHVDYNPAADEQIPCKDIGLPFKVGDILQIVSKDDPQWWQARNVREWSRIGLVPSETFEETRKAGSGVDEKRKKALGGLISIHKRRKVMYNSGESNGKGLEGSNIRIYEEVGRLCPFGRRVVVLVGAGGVGRRTLKAMLLAQFPESFATVVPYTSREPKPGEQEGREYHFKDRKSLQKEVDGGGFLEWGEYQGNVYGTSLASVRSVIKTGRLCVLDCGPAAIKWLYNEEFMPYVVYVAPPPLEELRQLYKVHPNRTKPKSDEDLKGTCEAAAEMEAQYAPLFDLHLVNRNVDVTFRRLTDALESLKTDTQWVPINWLYG